MATLTLLIASATPAQIRQLADVRAICAEGILSKNFESNEVLGGVLSDYYERFERQFREQAQHTAKLEFFYDGTAGHKMAIWFPVGHVVDYNARRNKCDAEISSTGEVQAISPTVFRVTIFLSINGLLSEQDMHLSEVEKANRTVALWKYQNASAPFTRDRLDYTADGTALKAAFALAAARR